MADEVHMSALYRRHEQMKRWQASETNLEPPYPREINKKVKFTDGTCFLAGNTWNKTLRYSFSGNIF